MPICDVCNAEGEGTLVPAKAFKQCVAAGLFNPFALGLTGGNRAYSAQQNFALFSQMVEANETDWLLCSRCNQAYQRAAAHTPPSASPKGPPLPESLDAIRRLYPQPSPPSVPADWKPGVKAALFGRGKPWGDAAQAVALIRSGRIAEGRELLLRIVAAGKYPPAVRLLLCLEALRPPADDAVLPSKIFPTVPVKERSAVDALFHFSRINYDGLGKSFLAAAAIPPVSDIEGALLLFAFVGASDFWMQTQILLPRKQILESSLVTSINKALAQLLERRHDEAWKFFSSAAAKPESIVDTYRTSLKADLSPAEKDKLVKAAGSYARVGQGLVLYDLGYERHYRPLFRELSGSLDGNLGAACRLLS